MNDQSAFSFLKFPTSVSIVVCCYNSANRITETVAYLAQLEKPENVDVEVIVIDNASTDDTAQVAMNACSSFSSSKISFKIILEPEPGLTRARMKGITESKGEFIVFCDDDNHLGPAYIVGALEIFQRDSTIGIVGGRSLPKFSLDGRKWLSDFFTAIAVSDPLKQSGPADWVFGAGMVVRKDLFFKLTTSGVQILLSGRKGSSLTSGEDAEICCLARCLGMGVFYSSKISFYHDISERRLRKKYYLFPRLSVAKDYIYLYILEQFASGQIGNVRNLRRSFLAKNLGELFYFTPRIIFGQHRFYSYCMLYSRLQMLLWMTLKPNDFSVFYEKIRKNLSSIFIGEASHIQSSKVATQVRCF